MAKRGYRGAHPYNDMKVATTDNDAANLNKLTKEYNKTGAKHKYGFIKSHDGFNPCASATVTASDVASNTNTLIITSTKGFAYSFLAHTNTTNTATGQFSVATGEVEMMTALHSCFTAADSITKDVFTATLDTTVGAAAVTITQVEPGPHGNTSIFETMANTTATNFTGG
jgi:hypothetical protein